MKRIAFLLCILFCINTPLFAEDSCSNSAQDPNARYKLYPTQNMWTFLKLDTMTGRIWQVQYSVDGAEYRFETVLSDVNIIAELKKKGKIGRFALYPTQNTYNFILLDQIDGNTYQVQWGSSKKERMIIPISY